MACARLAPAAAAESGLPANHPDEPITVAAAQAIRWQEGTFEVWHFEAGCRIEQGATLARADQAVLWIQRGAGEPAANNAGSQDKLIAYLEGQVQIEYRGQPGTSKLVDSSWLGRFFSNRPLELRVESTTTAPLAKPALYQRALARRSPAPSTAVRRTQFAQFGPAEPPLAEITPPGTRRLRAYRRSNVPFTIESIPNPAANETVTVIDRGVILIIEGLVGGGLIDVSTNRMVIWQGGGIATDLSGGTLQSRDAPLEIYMEGDVVFRQGDRVIYADRMYYDVRNEVGTVVAAEILGPLPQFSPQAKLKLKAELVQQTGPNQFLAQNAYVTSSRLGEPGYRLQSGNIFYEDRQQPLVDPFSGQPLVDPQNGEPLVRHDRQLTSRNNFLFLGPLPVFYWPRFSTDLEDPALLIRRVRVKNDNVFGFQVITDWDAYQILGLENPPEGTDLNFSLDYLSKRGFGYGPTFQYDRDDLFGLRGHYSGFTDFWAIKDHGHDDLGADRLDVPLEATYRFRNLTRHRHELPGDWRATLEVGKISDRNFLEQYYEREWDELKDESTGLELKKLTNNRALSFTVDARLNDFFTETQWLPRGDHFWIGQSLLGDRVTWFEHTSLGYGQLKVAAAPTNPVDAAKFALFPWEVPAEGERFITRHEVDVPFALGPVRVVPFALGEFAHWGQDTTFTALDRLYGEVGVRASIPVWTANPAIENELFNVHGVAHKAVLTAQLSQADANQDLTLLPLYDQLDDDALEQFRRRAQFNLYGMPPIPTRFDDRFYALRSNLGGYVTSPSMEIADDLTSLRLGLHQRWQTKRGLPGRRRIIDWIHFDTAATWFPNQQRDNFGEPFGLIEYDFAWHVGDRTTLLSDGMFDTFLDGMQTITFGGFVSRPPRSSFYVGMRLLDGPYDMKVLNAAYAYRMGPKWSSSVGTSVDLAGNGNIGQYATLTRIGESLLLTAGFLVDASKNNVGVNLSIQPRFLPQTLRFGTVPGPQVPLAGVYGLE